MEKLPAVNLETVIAIVELEFAKIVENMKSSLARPRLGQQFYLKLKIFHEYDLNLEKG